MKNKFEEFRELKSELSDILSDLVKPKKCICCDKLLVEVYPKVNHPLKQDKGLWSGGSVDLFSCGFGSNYDMMSFYFGICDECIADKIKSGHLESLNDIREKLRELGWENDI